MRTIQPTAAQREALRGSTVAVIGYGNQGAAHARNLRDSGLRVVVGQRPGGRGHALAIEHGFRAVPAGEAASQAALIILALPDETMAEVFRAEIAPTLPAGRTLGFVHGFNIRFGLIEPPASVDVVMVAPKGPGRLVRSRFEAGGGVAAMVAVHQDASGGALDTAVAWACGIGADRAALIETTFADECEADLFGEQAVLCGGVIELMKAGFDTLVEAGYPPELAYFECIHEVKQIVDLVYDEGFAAMRAKISNTARYGGLTRGPRLVTDETRAEMRRILAEVREGRFAKEWMQECAAGRPKLAALAASEAGAAAEQAGGAARRLAGR